MKQDERNPENFFQTFSRSLSLSLTLQQKVSMSIKREKRWARVLSCFCGSSSRRSSPSRFRGKKKTVPVDADTENDLIVASDEHEKMPPAKVSAAPKKGFFKKTHKNKGRTPPALNPQLPAAGSTQVTNGAHRSPVSHVTSKCEPETEPASHFEVPGSVQTGTKTNHKSLAKPGAPSLCATCRVQNKRMKKKRDGEEGGMGAGLIVLAMTLAAMLLGGRMVAIVCVSAWFYIIPYFRTATINLVRKNSYSSDTSSEQYKKKKVDVQELLERNGRSTLFR